MKYGVLIVVLVAVILLFTLAAPLQAPDLSPSDKQKLFGDQNNNPFNVKAPEGDAWRGQMGVDSRGLAIFDSLANGIRAGMVNILSQFLQRPGLNLADFGQIYAPAGVNGNAWGYGYTLATQLGHDPVSPYPILQRDNFERLAGAVLENEEGAPSKDALYPYLTFAAGQAQEHFGLA